MAKTQSKILEIVQKSPTLFLSLNFGFDMISQYFEHDMSVFEKNMQISNSTINYKRRNSDNIMTISTSSPANICMTIEKECLSLISTKLES